MTSSGKVLQASHTLADEGIEDGDVVSAIVREVEAGVFLESSGQATLGR